MLHHRTLRSKLLFSVVALSVTVGGLTLRAAAPTAPSNLTASVNGLVVSLNWSASANAPTQYVLQAGFSPGQTAITVGLNASTTSFTASAAAGTYYVRIVAVNADGTSAPSNEVTVVVSSGCAAPSAPLNLRAIIRGTEAFLFWRRAEGTVSSYTLQAGTSSGSTFTSFSTARTTLNANVGGGRFFARVIATGPCGNSQASNEIQLDFPSNTVRVADPDPGTSLGLPDIQGLIERIHAENPGLINQSCPTGRKYENNPWQDRIVDRLRQYDTRFGYNGKPTRTAADNNGFPVIAAGDEITFFAGAGQAQGSRNVYALDILFGHCGSTPSLTFRNFTGEEDAFWTGAGRFNGDEVEQPQQ
ncbi:MAG TPA: fibronectin type III domain-containing protein [Vicinamibacterales bacterium]|nr:fibronectin type III domain-containing protein [Vicinamibacterales bacterium]